VPDEIIRVGGKKESQSRTIIPVTEALIAEALTMNDYHENLYFENPVKVEAIKK
jgi:hypothetical protein